MTGGSGIGPPLRLRGPAGPWQRIRRRLREHGAALVYGLLDDWVPEDPEGPGLRRLLGTDWARYEAMTQVPVRARFAASRRLVKCVAAGVIEAEPHTVELAYGPGGRPSLRGCDQIDISLSHTGGLLLVGVSRRGAIGVDVELSDRRMRLSGIEQRFWTPYEIEALAQVEEGARVREMVRLWTLKEAYTKAIGQGMRFRFKDFGFAPGGRAPRVLTPDGGPGTGPEWRFGTGRVEDRYTVSWALHDTGSAAAAGLDEGLVAALTELAAGPRP